jgi:hypothetical protein
MIFLLAQRAAQFLSVSAFDWLGDKLLMLFCRWQCPLSGRTRSGEATMNGAKRAAEKNEKKVGNRVQSRKWKSGFAGEWVC